MSDNIKELVKRLRDRREYQSRGHGEVVDVADGDCSEAADALEAMAKYRADYEAMKAHNKELFGKLSAAEAERDRMKAALDVAKDHAKQNQRVRDSVSPYPNDHAKRIVWEKTLYHEGKDLWDKLHKALGGDAS